MLTLAITPAAVTEQRQVVSTVVLALARDPVTRCVWSDPHDTGRHDTGRDRHGHVADATDHPER